MGRRKRYRFNAIPPHNPRYHSAVTSKSLVERASEAANVLKKYADKSNLQRPRHILYVMARQNESLLELSECASTPMNESTSPKVKSSPESTKSPSPNVKSNPTSTSPEGKSPRVSISKRKLIFGDSKTSEFSRIGFSPSNKCSNMYVSPPRKGSPDIPTASVRVLSSDVQHLELPSSKTSSPAKAVRRLDGHFRIITSTTSTDQAHDSHAQYQEFSSSKSSSPKALRKPESPIKIYKEDPITSMQKYTSPIAKDKATRKLDSGSPAKEFKIPELSEKHVKDITKPSKRPRLNDSVAEIPEFHNPGKKEVEILAQSLETKMDISPHKGDKENESPTNSPTSSIESESPLKINTLITSVPIVKDDEIEIDVLGKSETDPTTCFISQSELKILFDDPSRVESIKKAVEELLKDGISPKKKSRNFIPGKGIKSTMCPDPGKNSSMLSNPNVLAYLQLRFKSVSDHRNKCMGKIYNYVEEFKMDANFLYYYSQWVFFSVEDIPIEGKVTKESGSIKDLQNLKEILMDNSKRISKHLLPITNIAKSDMRFWAQAFKDIRILNDKIEPFLFEKSCSQMSIEALQEYETNLKMIWAKMDGKALILDGLISSLLGISTKFLKLIKDFAKFLILIEVMIPSSVAASKAKKLQTSLTTKLG